MSVNEKLLWGFVVGMLLLISAMLLQQPLTIADWILGISPLVLLAVFGIALIRAKRQRADDRKADEGP